MKIETLADRNNTYGFPFTFHTEWGGKCFICPESPTETSVGYLLIDILFSGVIAVGIFSLYRRRKQK